MLARYVKMRETSVEDVVRSHPGVREVAALRDDSGRIVAFVVPEDSYLSDELGCGVVDKLTLSKWRKTYDLSQLTKEAAVARPGFNVAGWNSSYTRQPIPDEQIQEWVDTTVASILELKPRRLYEIGCGTGLLLTRLAPVCERYVASDFSSAVLARLRQQLQAIPVLGERVELSERQADDFNGLEADSFDIVVLNSVAQYFPSLAYLTNVLEQAAKVVKPGGHVYVGDVRSLPLFPVFANSVELFQAASEVSVEELKARVRHRMERERELVVSQAYFLNLQSHHAKISRVEIQPERGRADNEMTRFRFQAVLYVGHSAEPVSRVEFHEWDKHRWTLDNIRKMIERGPDHTIGIKSIQNPRIAKDLAAIEFLNRASAKDTVSDLRNQLATSTAEGILPDDLLRLQEAYPEIAVHLSWTAARRDGSYDAVMIPGQLQKGKTRPVVNWPQPAPHDLIRFANAPGHEKIRRDLIEQIQAYANENLSPEDRPSRIEIVDSLVRDESGKIDAATMLTFMS